MKLQKQFNLLCPYCGVQQTHSVIIDMTRCKQNVIRTCDIDEGGCEKDFVVEVEITTTHSIGKIDWELKEPRNDQTE